MDPKLLKSLIRFEARQHARVGAYPLLPFIYIDSVEEVAFMDSGQASIWQAFQAAGRVTGDQSRRAEEAGVALYALVIPNGESQLCSHDKYIASVLDKVTLPVPILMLLSAEPAVLRAARRPLSASDLLVPSTTGLEGRSTAAISPPAGSSTTEPPAQELG